jgi:hypothetical protein
MGDILEIQTFTNYTYVFGGGFGGKGIHQAKDVGGDLED